MSGTQPINIFPQSPHYDPSIDLVAGDPSAPVCNRPALNGGTWLPITVRGDGASVDLVTVFVPERYGSREDRGGQSDRLAPGTRVRLRAETNSHIGMDLWLSSRPGYPTIGGAVGATQFQFTECRALLGRYTCWIAQVGIREYDHAHYFVTAYCPLASQLVIQALGTAADEKEQSQQVAILATLRVEGPR